MSHVSIGAPSATTTPTVWQRAQADLRVGLTESGRLIRLGLRALLVERAPLAAAVLLIGWPALAVMSVRGRKSGAAQKEKVSPFIYTMQ